MLGKPKYKYQDEVQFKIGNKVKTGKVYIIDKYGTFEDDSDVSYDIMVDNDEHIATRIDKKTGKRVEETCYGPVLYKHIREDYVWQI